MVAHVHHGRVYRRRMYRERMPERTHTDDIRAILRRARTVAVLGASSRTHRAGHYVPRYLHDQGYAVYAVNPEIEGAMLFGHPAVARLTDVHVAVDVVDVFRRPEYLPDHLPEILAMDPLPEVVWLQQGIRNDAFAATLADAGIHVVQDRCMLADHQRLM